MLVIPLSIILLVYLVFIVVFLIFFFLNIYHLDHTASFTIISFLATAGVFAAGVLVLAGTWSLLSAVDWRIPLITINISNFFRPVGAL